MGNNNSNRLLYGIPNDAPSPPETVGVNPFDAPELVDPYTDPHGGKPAYGDPAPLKKAKK